MLTHHDEHKPAWMDSFWGQMQPLFDLEAEVKNCFVDFVWKLCLDTSKEHAQNTKSDKLLVDVMQERDFTLKIQTEKL